MFCIKCGTEIKSDTGICDNCGIDMNEEIKNVAAYDNETEKVVVTEPTEEKKTEGQIAEQQLVGTDCLHSYNNMDYEEDIIAKKQLKKARRLADASLGTGIAAVTFLILGVVLIPLFWFLWFVAFMLGIASFVLSFLSSRAMYELMHNDLYEIQVKKVKITYRKGKIAASIAMISAFVGVAAVVISLYYFATVLLQSDFTEAVQLLWDLVYGVISKLF